MQQCPTYYIASIMVNYRRNYIEGGEYFFTVALKDRKSTLLIDKFCLLQNAVLTAKKQYPFKIKAYVILPEHLHMLWMLPRGEVMPITQLAGKLLKLYFQKLLI